MKSFIQWLSENYKFAFNQTHAEDDPQHVFFKGSEKGKFPDEDPAHVFYGDFDKFKKINPNASTVKNRKPPINFGGQSTIIGNCSSGICGNQSGKR